MFNSIPNSLWDSTNFLDSNVDLPHHDPLVYAQYVTSYYEVTSMESIKLTGESKTHFHYFYLIPNSNSLTKEHKSASYNCEVE